MIFKKCYISTSIRPMNTKLGRIIPYNEKFLSTISSDLLIPWSRDITWYSKMIYRHSHKKYEHQTWQDDTLQWKVPIYNFQWPFDPVVTRYHMLFKNCHISTSIRAMNTKLGRMIPYNEKFLSKISSDVLTPESRDITCYSKNAIYSFHFTFD